MTIMELRSMAVETPVETNFTERLEAELTILPPYLHVTDVDATNIYNYLPSGKQRVGGGLLVQYALLDSRTGRTYADNDLEINDDPEQRCLSEALTKDLGSLALGKEGVDDRGNAFGSVTRIVTSLETPWVVKTRKPRLPSQLLASELEAAA